ncbi:MAG: hypothetical protein KTR20_10445 [Cellvibrionaceae bacterium]|nr:hypothetical protein [Cellvibrionaceae bacterium]
MTAQQLIDQAEHTALHSNDMGTVYMIQPGDTLSDIIRAHYNADIDSLEYNLAMNTAISFNDNIEEEDYIRAGEAIRLMPLPNIHSAGYCPAPEDFYKEKERITRHKLEPMGYHHSGYVRDMAPRNIGVEQDIYRMLALIEEYKGLLALGLANTGAEAFAHLTGPANVALAQQVGKLYEEYKLGNLTKGQYDGQRAKLLKQLSSNLGILEKAVFWGKTSQEAIRISRFKSVPVTHNISAYASHLNTLSRLGSQGAGIILAGINGKIACDDISATEDRKEKNEIFVEYATSTLLGGAASYALGIFLITNPVGWTVALTLGAATAFGAIAAGKGLAYAYGKTGTKVDLVEGLGIDKICG